MAILNDKNYVEKAELVIKQIKDDRVGKQLTTTKIRNLLALTSALYDAVQLQSFDSLMNRFNYLRVQFVYQAGRDDAVKVFVEKAKILESLSEVNDKASLIRFCRYMEALVAYFKYYGGKD
ncbi:type III-A CRISPR-associated protein Csm2 [Tuanshanicoccus lijuaniae]|uniref:type III-A CRISPR-associated protein Csm2 n=1 Tax=Aerococcaceae bacterium zg-1292 TaxID=2774330 RepID=UPI001BD88E6E|nr:type III-A CRISPR-associated protein Csm2 [Aerococcaceae bacterium zg-A91]MBS4458504.1 type III-A CRISPR-associated protein Csm2 [Aerococcaceae bacterium zg-BR33]